MARICNHLPSNHLALLSVSVSPNATHYGVRALLNMRAVNCLQIHPRNQYCVIYFPRIVSFKLDQNPSQPGSQSVFLRKILTLHLIVAKESWTPHIANDDRQKKRKLTLEIPIHWFYEHVK